MNVEKSPGRGEKEQIVVTEIPYQVNKARTAARIAELMRDKKIEGISEVRDESDREGIRLVVELKKDVIPQVVINHLYRQTDLQTSFGVINLAIVQGRPAVLNLKETLEAFIAHRRDVVTRRTRFQLRKAEEQREVIEGLGVAVTDVDRVVATIRASADADEAKKALMALRLEGLEAFVLRAGRPQAEIDEAKKRSPYTLSERQAKAILEMRLSRLTGLEQEKLAREYGELSDAIARYKATLASQQLLDDVIVMELEEIRSKYADKRRTEIVENEGEIQDEDLIQEEDMVVTVSHGGYIKRTSPRDYRAQRRGGKGRIGMEARDEDWVSQLFVASTHAYVFFFSDKGKVYVKKVYEIPQAARTSKGRAVVNFIGMEPGEKVQAIVDLPRIEKGKYVVTLTRKGQIKKTELDEYENFREKGIIGVKVDEGDTLLNASLTDGTCDLLIATKDGQSIRFGEDPGAADGPGRVRRQRHRPRRRRRGGGARREQPGADQPARRLLEWIRQAHGDRGVSQAEPRRQGHHPHRRERAEWPGGRHQAREGGRRGDAHHGPRANAAHPRGRDPRDGPQRAGRAHHDHGRGRAHRGARAPRRERRRRREHHAAERQRGKPAAEHPAGRRPELVVGDRSGSTSTHDRAR